MRNYPTRRNVPHWEYPGGTVCLTWRLHRAQAPLRPEERGVVLDVVGSGEPRFMTMVAVVVMDDHVHALVRPAANSTGQSLATAWKSISAHRLCREHGRVGPIWQRAYFDRWMRSPKQADDCKAYVMANPIRRWPEIAKYPWLVSR